MHTMHNNGGLILQPSLTHTTVGNRDRKQSQIFLTKKSLQNKKIGRASRTVILGLEPKPELKLADLR